MIVQGCADAVFLLLIVCYTSAEIVFREEPRDTTIVKGQPLTFHCTAEDSTNPSANIVVEWRKDGATIQQRNGVTVFNNGTLYKATTQDSDEGSYSCFASLLTTEGVIQQKESVAARLYFAYVDPVFLHPSSQTAIDKQDDPVWFQCISGNSRPPSTITWEKDGIQVTQANGILYYETAFGGDSLMTSGTLQINSVSKKHEGRYQCLVHNPLLPEQVERSNNFTLTINPNPGEPYINIAPTSQIIPVGQSVTFPCSILGDPMPQMSWNKAGEMGDIINVINSDRYVLPDGSLYFDSVQESDEGRYVCTGTSRLGTVSTQAVTLTTASMGWTFSQHSSNVEEVQGSPVTLTCRPPSSRPIANVTWYKDNREYVPRSGAAVLANPGEPYINIAPTSQIIPVGQSVTFPCSILGDPMPQMSWNKAGEMGDIINVINSDRYVLPDGSLYFDSVQESDEGRYVCTGTSRLGTVSTQAVTLTTASMGWTFSQHSSNVEEVQGSPVTLTCRPPSSRPIANVTWYKDNREYVPRSGAAVLDVGDLYFSAITKEDEGEYFCIATNEYIPQSVTSDAATLTVRVGASITEPPARTEVTLGGDLTLTCLVTGDPTPDVYWYKDNSLISNGQRVTIGNSGQLLHIINVIGLDQGTYKCATRNLYGSDEASEYVDVLIPPQITTGPGDVNVGMGASTFLTCQVIGDPVPMVIWYKDQLPLDLTPGDNSKYQKTNQGLHIYGLVLSDSGSYKCEANNKIGTAESAGRLTVEIEPVMHEPPINKTVNQGVVVYFSCKANGIPSPTIRWQFNGSPLPVWASVSTNGQGLTISSATQQTIGRYTCIAENNQGSVMADTYLNVRVAPIIQPIEDQTIQSENRLLVQCVATGTPEPTYQWLKGQDVIIPGGRISFPVPHILVIDNLINDDQGIYRCVATNTVSSTRESFNLEVIDIPGQPALLEGVPVSATSIQVIWVAGGDRSDSTHFQLQYRLRQTSTWLTYADNIPADTTQRTQIYVAHGLQENEEYEFQVLAVNVKGSSPPSNVELVATPSVTGPSSPRNFQVLSINATAAVLQWEIPEKRSGPIDIYVVEYFRKNTNDYASIDVAPNDQYTIDVTVTGLQPITAYVFRVCGATLYNEQRQWGNYTAYIEQITLPGPPGAGPVRVTVEAISSTSLQVFWSEIPPEQHNGGLLGYEVFYADQDSSNTWEVVKVNGTSRSALSIILPGLTPWTDYSVKVRGYNAPGDGPYSLVTTHRTLADAPSSSPADMIITVVNQTTLAVEWEAVPVEFRLGRIDGYRVSYQSSVEGSTTQFVDIPSPSMDITLTGLLIATTYMIQVAAYNNGTNSNKLIGPTTAYQAVTTLDGIPAPVTSLNIEEGPGYLFLQWQPPTQPNGDILGYVVEYRAQAVETETEVAATVTVDTVAAVTPGKTRRRRRSLDMLARRRRSNSIRTPTHGKLETSETRYNLTSLQPDMRFWVTVAARTNAGLTQDVIKVYASTEPALPTKDPIPPKPDSTEPPTSVTSVIPPKRRASPFDIYPLSSIIIFVSAVALAGLALLLAMIVMLVWCRGRDDRKALKRANLLLPNEQTGSQASSSRQPSEDFIMDTSGSGKASSLMEATRLSTSVHTIPGDEFGDLSQMENGPLDPTRPRALSSPPINHMMMHGANGDPYAESSGPSSGRSSRGAGRGGVQSRLYTQAKSPRHSRYQQVNVASPGADGSDSTPENLEELYSKVNRSARGPNRMKKDSLAAIAVLLDEEEEGSMRSADGSSVVIANQRTTL